MSILTSESADGSSSSVAISTFPRRHAASRRFTLGAPRSFSVSEDGLQVLFLRSDGAFDSANSLWVIERSGDARKLFDAKALTGGELTDAEKARRERLREQAGGVVSYNARSDGSEALFVLSGSLLKVLIDSAETIELESDGNAFDPTFEPGGDRVAYVSGAGLRVTGPDGDGEVPGTFAESETVTWGTAEFVAAEEMGRSRGYWWDPSGGRMAATRVDTSPVEKWWIAAPADPAANPREIRYPAAGTANAEVELWIVDIDTGPQHAIDWTRNEFEYLAKVSWGERFLLTVQTRDQRTLAVLEVDPETGETSEILRLSDDHWVELQANTPLVAESGLVMVVDDQYRRLSLDGRPLEHGDGSGSVQVRSLIGLSLDGQPLVTVTTDGTDSVLAAASSSGELTFLSDEGDFVRGVTAGGTTVVNTATPENDPTATIQWNDGSTTELESLAEGPGFSCTPSFHVLGERKLNGALCLPTGHDGSPLPVLLDPYGGPHAQRVLRVRNAYATSQWFAEQGFAVLVVDGRGTPGRGPAFEREIFGDFASKVLDDQIDALHAMAEQRPELDLTRVGIRGWSFGGYLAALAALRRPDAIHAAIAGAPVTEWRLYDTHYTERYLGHPDLVPEHYEQSSLLPDAARLERPLMLIHGLADDNVVAAHTLQFSRALLEAGRPHEVLPLSGVTHMTPQENVAENLLHLQRDFLLSHLGSDRGEPSGL